MQMLIGRLACFFFCMILLVGCTTISVVNSTDQLEVEFSLEKNEIAFTYFDLPSGEATLIQSGQGGTVLINTGDPSSQVELARKLHMYHVSEIDALIFTNLSEEYSGNVQWLISHYQISSIYVPSTVKDTDEENLFSEQDKVTAWEEGVKHEILPNLTTEVLFTGKDEKTERGLVLLFTYGQHRTLYMGIANKKVEELLTSKYDLKSTILKVGDFGSSNGTSQPFLEKVDPQVAILFSLEGKRPSEYVLERLQETWIDVYQTNKMGAISIKCTPENYEIWTVRANGQDYHIAAAND